MVRDLDFPVEIIKAPLIRDEDGLALSSRNAYLTADERSRALSIHRGLLAARSAIEKDGLEVADRVIGEAKELIRDSGGEVDYLSILDCTDLNPPRENTRSVLLAAAAWFGKTRLIDNEIFNISKR